MGRSYYPVNEKLGTYDINFAGADLLGLLHKEVGIGWQSNWDGFPGTVGFMDAKDARECGQELEQLNARDFYNKYLKESKVWGLSRIRVFHAWLNRKKYHLWDGTVDELHAFIQKWAKWLQKSDGYRVY